MHGSTKQMVDYLVASLVERGVNVEEFNLAVTDIGKLVISLVDAATIVVGVPTVLAGLILWQSMASFLPMLFAPRPSSFPSSALMAGEARPLRHSRA
jgi:flavorubredoxin